MDAKYIKWMQDNEALVVELSSIKKRKDETILAFHGHFNHTKIHPSFKRGVVSDYVFTFDPEFRSLL